MSFCLNCSFFLLSRWDSNGGSPFTKFMTILLSYVQILKQSAADYLREPSYASQVDDRHKIIAKLVYTVDMRNTPIIM
jgi:hypothetical protein